MAALLFHECFDFKSPDYKPSGEYQFCRLHFVYDVKPDLRFKAWLVCDGSRVDPKGLSTKATVVKGISVRLMNVIADSQGLSVLCGDAGNAFIQAMTNKKNILDVVLSLVIDEVLLLLLFVPCMV